MSPITHWVTISNFKDSLPYPNDSDLSRHEDAMVSQTFFLGLAVVEVVDHSVFHQEKVAATRLFYQD